MMRHKFSFLHIFYFTFNINRNSFTIRRLFSKYWNHFFKLIHSRIIILE